MVHPNNLDNQLENLRTLQQSYDAIAGASEAYNVGKTQLAAAITSKGVETSATESYPEMAEKVNAISQETYEINGGEMYAKQLFGSLTTPNYWNLYEVLANLLSDGRLVNYGGILLAEYYRGYDSLALAGAGAGGAYVVSDKDENGQFKMYTEDTTHVWETEFDGKGNRWVAYCFADAGHDFEITDTNTSPRSIHIGRNVGSVKSLVNGRISELVVTDGNTIDGMSGNFAQQWNKRIVIRNIGNNQGTILCNISGSESVFVQGDKIGGNVICNTSYGLAYDISSLVISCNELTAKIFHNSSQFGEFRNFSFYTIKAPYIRTSLMLGRADNTPKLKSMHIQTEDAILNMDDPFSYKERVLYLYYFTNEKSKSVVLRRDNQYMIINNVILQNGWCKPINVSAVNTTDFDEANMYAHILQRLKQDEPDCGDGVTITLGSTNLAKLTSEESVQLLDDLTNIYGYTFA